MVTGVDSILGSDMTSYSVISPEAASSNQYLYVVTDEQQLTSMYATVAII